MNLEGITLHLHKNFIEETLLGGRINKIYQPNKLSIILQIHNNQKNYNLFATCLNDAPHIRIINKMPVNPENAPSFCMLMRKHLESGRITQIHQNNLERIISFDVDTLGIGKTIVTKNIVFELIGKNSNIILVKDNIIIDSMKHIGISKSRFRQIVPQKEYLLPPMQTGKNILLHTTEDIMAEITKTKMPLHKSIINATLGIGPFTAKEIIWRSGLPIDINIENLDTKDFFALKEAFEEIILPIKNNEAKIFISKDITNKAIALTPYIPTHLNDIESTCFENVNSAIENYLNTKSNGNMQNHVLAKFVFNEISRINKKIVLLENEYAESIKADILKNIANNIMANLHIIKKGQKKHTLIDYTTNEKLDIELEELLSPVENAELYYKKYNKAKRAVEQIEKQLLENKSLVKYLSSIEYSLLNIQTNNELNEIKEELKSIGLLAEKTKKQLKQQISSPIKIILESGAIVYIGKNNKQNDIVTFKMGRPNDIWMHAKDIPGSHIIIKTEIPLDEKELQLVAMLSAYFSKAKDSSNIPIDFTFKKHVKKPAGAKPGFVIYDNQKTIFVTPDKNIVEKIIEKAV